MNTQASDSQAQPQGQGQPEALQAAETLLALMEDLKTTASCPVAILATAEDVARLHSCLRQVCGIDWMKVDWCFHLKNDLTGQCIIALPNLSQLLHVLTQAGAFGNATRLAAPGQAGRVSLMSSACAEADMRHVRFEHEQLCNMAARAEGWVLIHLLPNLCT